MKSRADYMSNACTHREYYGQFITPAILKRVEQHIGLDRIKRSTDEHMNDIPLSLWDGMSGSIGAIIQQGIKAAGDTLSLSSCVCVAKEAAKQIKESLTR